MTETKPTTTPAPKCRCGALATRPGAAGICFDSGAFVDYCPKAPRRAFKPNPVDPHLCDECGRRLGVHAGEPSGPRWCF